MNKSRALILLLLPILSACSGISDTRPEPLRKSEYFLEHGVSAFENSDYVAATDFLHKALSHYRSIDNTMGILLSHINLAETALAAGNFPAAESNLSAAEKISRVSGYANFQSRLNLLRSQVHWRKHDKEKSLALLQGLLPTFDEEQRSSRKPDLIMLGAVTLRTDIAFSRDDETKQEARLWLRRLSLMLPSTEDNTQLHQARLLRFEAQLAYYDNAPEEALEKLEQTLQLYRQAAARPAIAATLTESGLLLMKMQRWHEAEEKLQRALYIRLWIMDRIGSRELLEHLQQVYQALGDNEHYLQSREQVERIGLRK